MIDNNKKLFLLDAYALIYRAYYAMSKTPRFNSQGVNTTAVMGFANTLLDIIQNEKPSHIAVVFDTAATTTREIEYTAYKANREATPEDILTAVPYIYRLIQAFNIPTIGVDGYEADDVIGALAKQAELKGYTTFMMTPDKDFGQLVSPNIFLYKPGKFGQRGEVWGVDEVCKRYEIKRPEQVIDILGLMGDAVDNIPGVPGVGEKTAIKLLKEYDNMENLLQNASSVKGKVGENLVNFAEQAIMSKRLATIILDVPIELEEEDLKLKDIQQESMVELLTELEFRQFSTRLQKLGLLRGVSSTPKQIDLFSSLEELPSVEEPQIMYNTIGSVAHKYHLMDTQEKRHELIAVLSGQKSFCFDTETTGVDPHSSELVGISFSIKPHEAWYVPIPLDYNEALDIVAEFKHLLEDESIEKIGQNLKYDISVLRWYEINVKGSLFDTMLAHYLIQPEMKHGMDILAETYLNYQTVPIEELIGKKGKDQLTMRNIADEAVCEYSCEDADITLQLKQVFEKELAKDNLDILFKDIETPLIPVLSKMEAEGVALDSAALNEISALLEQEIKQLEQEIYELAGMTFNISSPKQLGEVLFDVMKIAEKPKKTATKQYSTSEDTLSKYASKHPIISHILDYRGLSKLKSTYVDALPALVNPRTGRIHTSYNQAVTSTGRLSSNNPNLQNIPIRTERGREIRKAFVPRNSNYILLSADYSQIELRIIAELSADKGMKEAFLHGIDIHTATAAKVYGVTIDEVTKEMRRNAKTVNFGIIYGISAFGLSERLGIARYEASALIEQYFLQYPSIKDYMKTQVEFAKEHGYVETIMKRRRYIRDINSQNAIVRGFAERNAINAPIQGSAADMIKVAMINIHREFEQRNLQSRMVLQVHDELVFDVLKTELEEVKAIVSQCMQNALPMEVPLDVDIDTGNNWLEAH